jgi:[CysO sulfur-carrier protein]-S-L-cysteine hydrolase
VIRLPDDIRTEILAHCYAGFPLEACGLLAGDPDGTVRRFYPTPNEAQSARVYTVPGRDLLRADRDAEEHGWVLIGVMHSHTHTDAYPSPTDVAQAPDPDWHYVIVSLRDELASLRSFRIQDRTIAEEPVELTD